MFDILMMSAEIREVLIYALQHPEEFQAHFAERKIQEVALVIDNTQAITFNDKDLLVGTSDHNRPLSLTGECEGQRVTRMLIDPGFLHQSHTPKDGSPSQFEKGDVVFMLSHSESSNKGEIIAE